MSAAEVVDQPAVVGDDPLSLRPRRDELRRILPPDAPPDPCKWAILQHHAATLGLPFDSPPQAWIASRPALPDYLLAIGQSRHDPCVLYAFGHHRLGLTLGPITGEIVAALAPGEPPSVSTTPFTIERFG